MNGGKDCEAGDERQAVPVQVPIGWQRKAEHGGGVIYIRYEKEQSEEYLCLEINHKHYSPSNYLLSCLESSLINRSPDLLTNNHH